MKQLLNLVKQKIMNVISTYGKKKKKKKRIQNVLEENTKKITMIIKKFNPLKSNPFIFKNRKYNKENFLNNKMY